MIMKKMLLSIMAILACVMTYAQNEQTISPTNNTVVAIASQGAGYRGGSGVVYNPPRNIEGSVYLFDSWKNKVVINSGENNFSLRNANFNTKKNTFESKINNTDSIFTFDFTNIDRMVVNNKIFKRVFSPIDGGYKIYEVVAESGDYAVYKDHYIEIKEGNPNPMLVQTSDKYIIRDSYYMKKGKSFKRMKFKKSSIVKSFGNKAKAVEEYAKENNLSFKNEQQLQQIVSYYASL